MCPVAPGADLGLHQLSLAVGLLVVLAAIVAIVLATFSLVPLVFGGGRWPGSGAGRSR